jgi:2-oxoglutarate ferredoxin oxidoreductase subunit delta
MGIRIIEKHCKGCDLCIEYCPQKVYEKSTTPNEKGYYIPMVVHPELCTDLKTHALLKRDVCRFCLKICPSQAIEFTEDK